MQKQSDGRERRNGLLHPKAYLWAIEKQFDGGFRDIPQRLLRSYTNACKAWGKTPHIDDMYWSRKRVMDGFAAVLADYRPKVGQEYVESDGRVQARIKRTRERLEGEKCQ